MTPRSVVILRPEPGNTRTATAARALGLTVLQMPLYTVTPTDWSVPDTTGFDALLLTSANAVRHAGVGLDQLKHLPVVAVGTTTAEAAAGAGFVVAITGTSDARMAIAEAHERGFARLLHLAGRNRSPTGDAVVSITVYASDATAIETDRVRSFEDSIVLLHSVRAATRLAELVDTGDMDRTRIALAAISRAVADAAGTGWAAVAVATEPRDSALMACAAGLSRNHAIDHPVRGGDKHAMSEYVPTERPQARGPKMGVIIALVGLAFIAGLGLMGYAMKALPRFGGTARSAAATAQKQTGNSTYIPSQPLNSNGEPQAAAPIDTAVLATREAALAAQLAVLEARTAAITTDAAAAGGQATRAEGLLVAVAARRALDRGVGLGYLEEQLRLRFGPAQPRATTMLIQAAHQPVTLEDLRQGLDTIAPNITNSSDDGWLDTLQHQIDTLVVLRKAGTPSPMPADRLARARRLLGAGQVEAARAEVARLPGAAQAGNWLDAARRYVIARQALDVIENTALIGQPGQPQPVPMVLSTPATEESVTETTPDTTGL